MHGPVPDIDTSIRFQRPGKLLPIPASIRAATSLDRVHIAHLEIRTAGHVLTLLLTPIEILIMLGVGKQGYPLAMHIAEIGQSFEPTILRRPL